MFENSDVNLVEVLFRRVYSSAAALKNRTQSRLSKSLPFTDKSTGSCGLDEQPTCIMDQTSNGVSARPVCT